MPVLKVCSLNRQNKLAVPVTSYDIKTVLVAVSKRINIKGSRIVLEKDGTGIVDNETLNHYNTKEETTFMILQAGESWCAENVVCSKEVMDESRKENIPADCNNAATEPVQQENGSQATDDNPVNAETSQPNEQNAEVAIDSVLESKKIINWNDFKIPWITIDPNVLDDLRKKKKIDSKSVQKVVTRIVDEMRYFSKHIPKSAFTNVALQLRDAYPKSFEDVNRDGERCGDGYHTVLQKMTNYNNNENRPHMRKSLSNDLKIPLNKRRALANIKAGCKDWQPIEYDENSDIDSLENQRNVLSQFANFVLTDEATLKEVKEIFDTTYAYQRFFLNSIDSENSKVVNVVDTWPCLLHKPYIFWHFEKLTGHDVKEIENNMKADIQALLAYGAVKRFTEIDIDNCNEEQKFLEGIQIISKHFGDDLSNIILKHPENTDFDTLIVPDNGPAIVVIENDPIEYYVLLDGMCAGSALNCIEAVQMLLAMFFVFNRTYPDACKHFLEFTQMRFSNIYCSEASRSKSKNVTQKVYVLIKKLNKYECPKEIIS